MINRQRRIQGGHLYAGQDNKRLRRVAGACKGARIKCGNGLNRKARPRPPQTRRTKDAEAELPNMPHELIARHSLSQQRDSGSRVGLGEPQARLKLGFPIASRGVCIGLRHEASFESRERGEGDRTRSLAVPGPWEVTRGVARTARGFDRNIYSLTSWASSPRSNTRRAGRVSKCREENHGA